MHKLNLLDEFVLLSIDDTSGNYIISGVQFNYGLIGAALIELGIQGKIELEGTQVIVRKNMPLKDRALSSIAQKLDQETKELDLKKWLYNLQSEVKTVSDAILDRLIKSSILEVVHGKILWIFPTTKYPTENPVPERKLKNRIREIVLDKRIATADELMLLSLIEATGLIQEIFSKEERKQAKETIKVLTESNQISKELGETIQTIQTVIMVTTNAAIMSALTTTIITSN